MDLAEILSALWAQNSEVSRFLEYAESEFHAHKALKISARSIK